MMFDLDPAVLKSLRATMPCDVLVLTGAGLSAESGIPTFRDHGGLWEQHRLEEVATPEAWERDPKLVNRFYNERRAALSGVEPNPGHFALARLEEALGERVWLVTQNVDDLLERAGCRRVLHMHGELKKVRCTRCGAVHRWTESVDLESSRCARCNGRPLRPHIVWFGEVPFYLDDQIPEALSRSSLFISVGTSGTVYPAAGFVAAAKQRGAVTAEVNVECSVSTGVFDVQLSGRSGEILPPLVDALIDAG